MRLIEIEERQRPAVETIQLGANGSRSVGLHETPLTIPAAYQAIRIISQTLASLPAHVYQRGDDGTRTERRGDPVTTLLTATPNRSMGPMVFRETMQAHCLGWGNCFAKIEFSNRGVPIALVPYHPSQVKLDGDVEMGDPPRYIVQTDGGEIPVPASDMLHIPALGSMGVWGYSPVSLFRGSFSLAKETERYGNAFFRNGARPGGILTHPGTLKDTAVAKLRDSWKRMFASGAENAHKIAVLEEGMKYEAVALNPEDAQFLETRKFQIGDIARIFNVPPHMLGDLERATFSNIEHQAIEFVRYTLRPWTVRWEEELNRKLFVGRPDLFVEFDLDGLLRGDIASRYKAYSQSIQDGWQSRNEVRKRENLPVVIGLDSMLVPLNMGTAQKDGDIDDPSDEVIKDQPAGTQTNSMDRVVEVLRPCLVDPVARVCRASRDKRQRAAKAGRMDDWQRQHDDGFPVALSGAVDLAAASVLHAAWPDATSVAADALGVRVRAIGRLATAAENPDCEWIVNLVEGAILDIIREAGS